MNELAELSGSLKKVLNGEQKVGVEARLNDRDLLKMGATIFVSFFLAVLLANAITK